MGHNYVLLPDGTWEKAETPEDWQDIRDIQADETDGLINLVDGHDS